MTDKKLDLEVEYSQEDQETPTPAEQITEAVLGAMYRYSRDILPRDKFSLMEISCPIYNLWNIPENLISLVRLRDTIKNNKPDIEKDIVIVKKEVFRTKEYLLTYLYKNIPDEFVKQFEEQRKEIEAWYQDFDNNYLSNLEKEVKGDKVFLDRLSKEGISIEEYTQEQLNTLKNQDKEYNKPPKEYNRLRYYFHPCYLPQCVTEIKELRKLNREDFKQLREEFGIELEKPEHRTPREREKEKWQEIKMPIELCNKIASNGYDDFYSLIYETKNLKDKEKVRNDAIEGDKTLVVRKGTQINRRKDLPLAGDDISIIFCIFDDILINHYNECEEYLKESENRKDKYSGNEFNVTINLSNLIIRNSGKKGKEVKVSKEKRIKLASRIENISNRIAKTQKNGSTYWFKIFNFPTSWKEGDENLQLSTSYFMMEKILTYQSINRNLFISIPKDEVSQTLLAYVSAQYFIKTKKGGKIKMSYKTLINKTNLSVNKKNKHIVKTTVQKFLELLKAYNYVSSYTIKIDGFECCLVPQD